MKATINTREFNRLIAATKAFVDVHGRRPLFKLIKLEFSAKNKRVTAVALDGFRMAVENAALAECDEDFIAYIGGNIKLPSRKDVYAQIELQGNRLIVDCEGLIYGCVQPAIEGFDWGKVLPRSDARYKIAFNGDLLLSALRAAKISCGGKYSQYITLEIRGASEPIILRTNEEDIKLIMPIRICPEPPKEEKKA